MELPSYTDDTYGRRFLAGKTIFPEDRRIFHQVGYSYDYVAGINAVQAFRDRVDCNILFSSGIPGKLTIEVVAPQIIRLKMGQVGAEFEESSPMLLPFPHERPGLVVSDGGQACEVMLSGYRIVLEKSPFCLRVVSPQGETIFESETENLVSLLTAPPAGLRCQGAERWAFLSWRSRNQDQYYGLGEKFTRFEKTSSRATIWTADTCGSNTTDMSYKGVPLLFSTAGWGLLWHTSFRSYWEIGSFSYATGAAMVEDDRLDVFLLLAPDLRELVGLYTGLTGRPSLPPKWAFGLWMSRAAYQSRAQLEDVARRLRVEQIPCDVFNIDPSWLVKTYYNEIGVEICDFTWNEATWPDPEGMYAGLTKDGFSACIWLNPYLPEDSPLYAEAKAQDYLVKSADGGVSRLELDLAAGIVDFTNPAAKTWWQGYLIHILRQGAALFKVDFGDRVPESAVFANGKTGREMHNLYVHLYSEAVFEAVRQEKGCGMIWRRPGYIGSQRFPGTWAGDTQVTWEGMQGALRGGLSAAFSGEAFWSHDMGGFVGQKPPEELYIRWAQFGLFSPLARFHGTTPREPWFYSARAVAVVRHYTQLRYRLIPYLLAAAYESTQTGMPILRPLALAFQGEPGVGAIDDQYLLGGDLLVAPVMTPGVGRRAVYLPEGTWWPLEADGQPEAGGRYIYAAAPMESIPVYVRSGAVLPWYAAAPQHLKGSTPAAWIIAVYPGLSGQQGVRSLLIPEADMEVRIRYESCGRSGRLQVNPVPLRIKVVWVDMRSNALKLTGEAGLLLIEVEDTSHGAAAELDASQGLDIRWGEPV